MAVVHALGAFFSNNAFCTPHVPSLIDRSVQMLANPGWSPSENSSDYRKLHVMQAEILLAQYFFCTGRSLEGHYHLNAAVSMALSCGMHRIRSDAGTLTRGPSPASSSLTGFSGLFNLSASQDLVEESDRINLFWAIYRVDRCWSVVVGLPPLLSDNVALGTQIDTPWPVEVSGNQVVSSAFVTCHSKI